MTFGARADIPLINAFWFIDLRLMVKNNLTKVTERKARYALRGRRIALFPEPAPSRSEYFTLNLNLDLDLIFSKEYCNARK